MCAKNIIAEPKHVLPENALNIHLLTFETKSPITESIQNQEEAMLKSFQILLSQTFRI